MKYKKATWLILIAVSSLSALAQTGLRYQAQQVIDANGKPVPYVTVRVCTEPATVDANGLCSPLATIYTNKDLAPGHALSNPFSGDMFGNAFFYAAAGTYHIQLSNSSTGIYDIPDVILTAGGDVTGKDVVPNSVTTTTTVTVGTDASVVGTLAVGGTSHLVGDVTADGAFGASSVTSSGDITSTAGDVHLAAGKSIIWGTGGSAKSIADGGDATNLTFNHPNVNFTHTTVGSQTISDSPTNPTDADTVGARASAITSAVIAATTPLAPKNNPIFTGVVTAPAITISGSPSADTDADTVGARNAAIAAGTAAAALAVPWTGVSGKPSTFTPPNPSAGAVGGIKSLTCSGTDKISSINTDGTVTCTADQTTPGGAGITTFNTLVAATQTLAIGTSGNSPSWSSVTSTHTLNIPLATAGASVTAGLVGYNDIYPIKQCAFRIGSDASTTVLADTDDEADMCPNHYGRTMTIQRIYCKSDVGTPIIQMFQGANAVLGSNLTCGAGETSSNVFNGTYNQVADGGYLNFSMVTAGGSAHRVDIVITWR